MIDEIRRIAEVEFVDVVKNTFFVNYKLRIILIDNSFIDVNLSRTISHKFGFHWERPDNSIYRYDNFPDNNWKYVSTYPYHFHKGTQDNVVPASFSLTIDQGFRDFMKFVKIEINKNK